MAAYGSVPVSLTVMSDVGAVRTLAGPLASSPKRSPWAWDGRRHVEHAGSWDALPEWAQDWIRKAEEGPLWVVLGR